VCVCACVCVCADKTVKVCATLWTLMVMIKWLFIAEARGMYVYIGIYPVCRYVGINLCMYV
jgi:hypothetical protein